MPTPGKRGLSMILWFWRLFERISWSSSVPNFWYRHPITPSPITPPNIVVLRTKLSCTVSWFPLSWSRPRSQVLYGVENQQVVRSASKPQCRAEKPNFRLPIGKWDTVGTNLKHKLCKQNMAYCATSISRISSGLCSAVHELPVDGNRWDESRD